MQYILLAVTATALMFQNVFKQEFDRRTKNGAMFFSGLISLFAMLFFLAVNRDWAYDNGTLPYSAGFALSYLCATLFAVLAIRNGSLAKTALILSYSLLIPTLYGILFLGEPISVTMGIGSPCLVLSLFLINYEKETDARKVTWRWVFSVTMAFIGNGMCSVIQKAEQIAHPQGGANLFMIVALAISAVLLLGIPILVPRERRNIPVVLASGWWLALLCGGANGLVNLLVLYLNGRMSASILFPLISGGSMVLILLWSLLVRKERFSARQTVGFLLGILSIVLLNL